MLLEKPLPPSSGFDVRMENSGDIDNWGLEFALNTVNIKAMILVGKLILLLLLTVVKYLIWECRFSAF